MSTLMAESDGDFTADSNGESEISTGAMPLIGRILLFNASVVPETAVDDYFDGSEFAVCLERDYKSVAREAVQGGHDFVLLDAVANVTRGLEVLRDVRRHSSVPVMLLASANDSAPAVAALEWGADDFVRIPCEGREILARIRAILRRTITATPRSIDLLTSGMLSMWPRQRLAQWKGKTLTLTSTQFSLLEVLVRHVGRPVSKKELSAQALRRAHTRHDRSLDMHLGILRRKLGKLADGRPRIQAVHRLGFQLIAE